MEGSARTDALCARVGPHRDAGVKVERERVQGYPGILKPWSWAKTRILRFHKIISLIRHPLGLEKTAVRHGEVERSRCYGSAGT
eukprot:726727-Rhodomonas_salina.1